MLTIAILLGVITLLYIWLKWNYSFWKRNKVPGPEPKPFVGNIGSMFTFSEHWGLVITGLYNKFSNQPYIGYYKLLKPAIVARDPDLVKDIMITKFNSFRSNDFNVSKKHDELTALNPFFTRDEEWKEGRKLITPVFSSSKLKNLMPVMNGVGTEFVEFIKSYQSNEDIVAKDLAMRFAVQNLVKCAFSIDPLCFNKETESEFMSNVKELFEPSFWAGLKFLVWPIVPKWAVDFIPIPFASATVDHFIRNLVASNKASRSDDVQRHDFFQLYLQFQKKYGFDDTTLSGHSLNLFAEGTETSNTALSFALYELAITPNCQDKLFKEISDTLKKHNGQLTFECLQEMVYLEGVVLETLRVHPAVLTFSRVCTEPYTLPKTDGQKKPVTIQPDTPVTIPVQGIHMDPKYYPNAERFTPERFIEDQQLNRHKGMYFGFGEGPRICPGQRFGVTQVKLALAYITQNFHIKLSPNHKPIVVDPQTFMAYPKDGILIRLEAR
ncbi:probable cytochrome P450 6a13, partial [Sitodiplosis mosellana]|uniref:probable cytochrome P450 6a13 n=1 Tax=Sitodiplosis mosellana TaxID=263140 RepID=UPI002444A0B8